MRPVSYLVRCLSIASVLIGACQPTDQASLGTNDGGGMDGVVEIRSTAQALETGLCGPNTSIQANAPWPMRGGCPTRAAQSSEYGPVTGTKNWEVNLGGKVTSSPAIAADGSIFVGGEANKLVKINPATGAILKSTNMLAPVRSSPAIGKDGFLYVGSDLSRVYRVDMSTLALKWNYQALGRFASSPTILADGTIVIGSEDFSIYGLNPTTGGKKWSYTTSLRITSSPAIDPTSTTIYVGSEDLHLYALNANGTFKWKKNLGAPVYATPAVGRDGIIYVSAGTTVYALEPVKGDIRWQQSIPLSLPSSPAIGPNGSIYVGLTFSVGSGSLYSFGADGATHWKVDFGAGVESTPIIDRAGNIYFGTKGGTVVGLDSAGRELWRFEAGGEIIGSPALAKGGAVIIGSTNGKLFSIGTGAPRVTTGGACDEDVDCEPNLICGEGVGPRFGKPAGTGVCWLPSCENKVKDPDEIEIDCGGVCGSCTGVCSSSCSIGEQVTPPAQEVLRFAEGIFTRGSLATYQLTANKLATAGGHQLRYEDRGDGYGRLALFEGERTNRVLWSEELDRPEWYASAGFMPMALTPDWDDAPDGQPSAERLVAAAGSRSPTQRFWAPVPEGQISLWLRQSDPGTFNETTPATTRPVWADLLGQTFAAPTTWGIPKAWERRTLSTTQTGYPVELTLSHKGSWPNSSYPQIGAADYLAWGFQLEDGKFPSSYIPSTGSATVRLTDRLVYDAVKVPAWVRSGWWQFDVVPTFGSDQLAANGEHTLVAWENGSLALVRQANSNPGLRISSGTTVLTRDLRWGAGARITITLNQASKTIHVRGASQGDGETSLGAVLIPAGRIAVGAKLDGMASAFARMSELRRVTVTSMACVVDADCMRCGDGVVSGAEVCDTALDARCNVSCSARGEPHQCFENSSISICPEGMACPDAPNGSAFDTDATYRFCVPVKLCIEATTPACGDAATAPCGRCPCTPTCAGKKCGDRPSDGCGGMLELTRFGGQVLYAASRSDIKLNLSSNSIGLR